MRLTKPLVFGGWFLDSDFEECSVVPNFSLSFEAPEAAKLGKDVVTDGGFGDVWCVPQVMGG